MAVSDGIALSGGSRTLWAADDLLQSLRALARGGREDVLVCRYLGASMAEAKALFARAWEVLRHGPLGKRAIAPRVWST